jgi:hypothetical protein
MQDQKARIWDLQISRIIDILTSKPSPEESYRLCLLIANRRQNWNARTRETFGLVQALSSWVSEPGSTLLVVRAGPRAEARTKDLAANIINLSQLLTRLFGFSPLASFSGCIRQPRMSSDHLFHRFCAAILIFLPCDKTN